MPSSRTIGMSIWYLFALAVLLFAAPLVQPDKVDSAILHAKQSVGETLHKAGDAVQDENMSLRAKEKIQGTCDDAKELLDDGTDNVKAATHSIKDKIVGGLESVAEKLQDIGHRVKESLSEGVHTAQDSTKHAKEVIEEKVERTGEKLKEAGASTQERLGEMKEKMAEVTHEAKEAMSEGLQNTAEKLEEGALNIRAKVAEKAQSAGEAINHARDRAKDALGSTSETIKQKAEHAKDVASDTAQILAEKVKGSAEKVKGSAENLKQSASETASNVASKLEDTKQQIGDKVQDAADSTRDYVCGENSDMKQCQKRAKSKMNQGIEAAKQTLHQKRKAVEDNLEQMREDTANKAQQLKDKASEGLETARLKVKDTTNRLMSDSESTESIKERLQNTAEVVKEKVSDGFQTVADSVKDAVERAKLNVEGDSQVVSPEEPQADTSLLSGSISDCYPSTCSSELLHATVLSDPSHCWRFEGSKGHILIALDNTNDIPVNMALIFDATVISEPDRAKEAPKEVVVVAIKTDKTETEIGRFECTEPRLIKDHVQTFGLQENLLSESEVEFVRVMVNSNHGGSHTALCGLRIGAATSAQTQFDIPVNA